MFMRERESGELVEILDTFELTDPFKSEILGRHNAGEEMPEARTFAKSGLLFCSGEELPRCWIDPDYRQHEMRRTGT